jgi:hypothetical protein
MTFEVVTIIVSAIATALALASYFRTGRIVRNLGRYGGTWFEHAEDREVSRRPSEDDVDEPLPRRPLRPRAH